MSCRNVERSREIRLWVMTILAAAPFVVSMAESQAFKDFKYGAKVRARQFKDKYLTR